MKLADATMLNYSSPVPVLLISAILLGERLSLGGMAFLAVAFAGIALILKPGFNFSSSQEAWAGIAGAASAFVSAIAYVSIKVASRSLPSRFIVFTFAAVGTVGSLIPFLYDFVMPNFTQWAILIGIGTIATAAQWLMTVAYAGLPAGLGSVLSLSTVLFSTALGWTFWAELPDLYAVAGGFLVILGLFGAYRYRSGI
jgi:drug/metabolite transporter (DMT)-like permease